MNPTKVGAMIRRDIAPTAITHHAHQLQHGFDEVWIVEDLPYAGGISQQALTLANTTDVVVGHGIAPAPFRNPATLAMEWATLASIYPERVAAGIGHGVQHWMEQIGARAASPLTLLRETIETVRGLLHGQTVTINGRYINIDRLTLEYPPDTPPPILAGVTGPKSLRLSGAVADGTILPDGHGPVEVAAARSHIASGQTDSGRRDPHHLTVFATFYIGDGTDLAQPTPDISTTWTAAAATAEPVIERLQSLIHAGANSVILVPTSTDPLQQLQLAATDIVPHLNRTDDAAENNHH